jgi:3-dehydroquinate dehydratase II
MRLWPKGTSQAAAPTCRGEALARAPPPPDNRPEQRKRASVKPILVLNGPNLNLLGTREPEIYGRETLADIEALVTKAARDHGAEVSFRQSNSEAEIIGWIHAARGTASGIVINPAAFTHTSVAILDALNAFEGPVVEVHLSNVHKRESFRHRSYVSLRADAVIAGAGSQGYVFAVARVIHLGGGH